MNKNLYDNYIKILEEELVPAMGCTEPIAIAYAAAKVRETLGETTERISAKCSGNIIKNATRGGCLESFPRVDFYTLF